MTREDSLTKSIRESLMIVIAAALAGALVGSLLGWVLPLLGAAQFGAVTSVVAGFLAGAVVVRQAVLALRRHEQDEVHKRLAGDFSAIEALHTPLIAKGVVATEPVPAKKRVYELMSGEYVFMPLSKMAEHRRGLIWATIDLDFEKHKVLMVNKRPDQGHYLIEKIDGSILYAKREWADYWDLGYEKLLFDDQHQVLAWAPLSAGIRQEKKSWPEEALP